MNGGATGYLVAVAMSGGMDSSVAAALLLEQGVRVIGLTMRLFDSDGGGEPRAVQDARRVAGVLGISHSVVDLRREFSRDVVDYFVAAYSRGQTPNPCVECNRLVKLGALLRAARALGCAFLATGHYARVSRDCRTGRANLLAAADPGSDQSYVLYSLSQSQLSHLMLPVGGLSRGQVRRKALTAALPVSTASGSQDICFVEGNYRQFLARRWPCAMRPGPIRDSAGNTVGQHRGLPHYTVGQRKGLGLSAAHPLYVLRLIPSENALVVGTKAELATGRLLLTQVNWIVPPPDRTMQVDVRVRYGAHLHPATVTIGPDGTVCVDFDRPITAAAPGQSAVLYARDKVLGGGVITSAGVAAGRGDGALDAAARDVDSTDGAGYNFPEGQSTDAVTG